MIVNLCMTFEPVLAWGREAQDIESGVIACYVMLCDVMPCYAITFYVMLVICYVV